MSSDFYSKETYVKENEEPSIQADTTNQSIELTFEGMNLLIKNKTDETIIIIESSTKFFTKIDNEWKPYDTIRSALEIQSSIPSKTEEMYDFSKDILEIGSKEIKVVIYYQIGYEDFIQYTKDIVYVEDTKQ